MKIKTEILQFSTKGQGDLIDISGHIQGQIEKENFVEGQITISVIGSTASVLSIEYEPGLKKDLNLLYDQLAPYGKAYHHHDTWGDDNGSSHLRATLQGPSLTIPFVESKLLLGTWQQIVLAEFDTRPRDRKLALQLIGTLKS